MGKFNRGERSGGGRGGFRDRGDFGGRGGFRDRGDFGGRRSERPTMHKTTCDECQQNCEVPFKPTGERPVLCDQCFSKKRGDRPERSGNRDFNREKTMHEAICDNCGEKCEIPFRPTKGKPLYCKNCFDKINGSDRNKGGHKHGDQSNEQFAALNAKLDKILEALTQNKAPQIKVVTKSKKPSNPAKVSDKVSKKTIKKTSVKKKK